MNEQLKKDIAEWQMRADTHNIMQESVEGSALIDEARTLLLRCSESL